MPEQTAADVVIIGGGPGGYVAAIRAAQLGLSTVCVEMDKTLGGTCVNVGCIPSKALLSSSEHYEFARLHAAAHGVKIDGVTLDLPTMLKRKDDVVKQNTNGVEFLFRKNKITWAKGRGTLRPGNIVDVAGNDGTTTQYAAKNVIIATGSVPFELPFLKFDEERVLSNIGALKIPEVPKHLIVIGGGIIGLELGSVWRRLGSKVTVIELLPTILAGQDAEVIKEADKVFRKQGLEIRTGTKVTGGRREGDKVTVEIEKDGNTESLEADYVLVSVGRKPSLTGIDAAGLGLAVGKRGEITVDAQMRTNLPNVYAIGDAVGGKLLAHKAEEEGVIAAEVIAGHKVHMDYKSIPSVVYTWPEIASVGLTESEVKESGREYKVGKFPFTANGRARSMGEPTGFVKFVSDAKTDELLGCHMIGANVSELIAEVVLAFEYRGSSEDIGITVHSHPTLSEAVKEAALGVLGRTIHI
ncbi:MAG TPA: dihydrolipoyl dehydrogenase [Gemmatimonadaceae bacterium]|jgi:dihydrolipoamide dehydrogenase|nr:dihydrolipoyl dehydrogenase [Gemmatimonadaceae bacterium]